MRFLKNLTSIAAFATVAFYCGAVYADGDPLDFALTTETTINEGVLGDSRNDAALTSESTKSAEVKESTLKQDEREAISEEAVATVTADGDFLLPTYLLPGETATVTKTTTIEKTYDQLLPKTASTVPVVQENAVSVVSKENIVEPIEKTVSETDKKQEAKEREIDETFNIDALLADTAPAITPQKAKERVLIPLAPIAEVKTVETTVSTKNIKKKAFVQSDYADKVLTSLEEEMDSDFKMPHEMRITFYPRARSFSGQTLKWIKAFALTALKDPRLVVEVRASCAEADLQNARLVLVGAALREAGLSPHQIVVNYTNRPVDTMLLMAIPRQDRSEVVDIKKADKLSKNKSQVTKW